ncbi:uncharacterized protein [Amphiura filiformis]|uniref:uncharacterized protein n=1 Tax=Amphiura filiformis TaxID=82378 RepID=UPI003B211CA0
MSTVGIVENNPDHKLPQGGGGNGSFYLEPNSPEVIEMKDTISFTRLPQNPPDAIHTCSNGSAGKQEVPTIVAPCVNGTSPNHSIDTYGPMPGQQKPGENQQAMTTFGQAQSQPSQGVSAPRPPRPRSHYRHTYEELPTQQAEVPERLEENGHSPYGQNGHMSHTEVDQAMLFPKSSSQVPLTGSTGSTEKRPRKKMNPVYDGYQGPSSRKKLNPVYDGYQGPSKVISTKGSSKPPQHHGSPVKQCSSCSIKCLKSPCTTFLVILVVFLMVIAGVLIFMGKITTPASPLPPRVVPVSYHSQSHRHQTPHYNLTQLMPAEVLQRLREQDDQIKHMQEEISMLQNMLQNILGGSDENFNASLNTKVMQNAMAIEVIEEDINRQQTSIAELTRSVHTDQRHINTIFGDISTLKAQTTNLESNATSLDTQVKLLTARSETQTSDIRLIKDKNGDQDIEINDIEAQLTLVEQEYKFELNALNRTIYGELDVISKMPGPQGHNGSQGPMGEPGAGNLTQCLYGSQRQGGGFTSTPTETPWIGADVNFVLTAVTCTTLGGTSTSLNQPAEGKFKCSCSGNNLDRSDTLGRDCAIHFWQCPAIS